MKINVNGEELILKYENGRLAFDNNDNYAITTYQCYFDTNWDMDLYHNFSSIFDESKEKYIIYKEGTGSLKEFIWTTLSMMRLYKQGCVFNIGISIIDKRVDGDDVEVIRYELLSIDYIGNIGFLIYSKENDELLLSYSLDGNIITNFNEENLLSAVITDCLSSDASLYTNHCRERLRKVYNVTMSSISYYEEKLDLYLNNISKFIDIIPMSKVSVIIPSDKYEINHYTQSVKFVFKSLFVEDLAKKIFTGDNFTEKYKEGVLLHEYIHSIDINTSIENNIVFNNLIKSLIKKLKNTNYFKTIQAVKPDGKNYEYIHSYLLESKELFARAVQFYYLYSNDINNTEYSILEHPFYIPKSTINEVSVEIEKIIDYINQYSNNIRELDKQSVG